MKTRPTIDVNFYFLKKEFVEKRNKYFSKISYFINIIFTKIYNEFVEVMWHTPSSRVKICNVCSLLDRNRLYAWWRKNDAFAARTCIVVVVVTHESNMASYFSEAENLNGKNADMIVMWLGRRVVARGNCFSFQIGQILRTFTTFPTAISFKKGWDNISWKCHLTNLCVGSLYYPLSPWSMLPGFQNNIEIF